MQLRDYQTRIAVQACTLLHKYKIAYLSMQVRTGKTLTAFQTATNYGATSVLFLTKKKAISSIEDDYAALSPSFAITIINYEQLSNCRAEGFDLVILDEAHCLGQYPSPAVRTKLLKNLCAGLPVIYLSGTPTPESYSQIYHQFFVSSFSPFAKYKNFYAFVSAGYVERRVKYVFNRRLWDYKHANKAKIDQDTKHLFISYTQGEAGFEQTVTEQVLKVDMRATTYQLARKIKRDRVHIGKNGDEIIADTEVKLMQKLHQIYSGTVLNEQGIAIVFDDYKAQYIKMKFKGKKIAIFYNFKAEREMLIRTIGADNITELVGEFATTNKWFISQIQSGREGINLSSADCLVMFNIDYSSVSYQQAKARIQALERTRECMLYWIFSEGGIEEKIYERVINKQDYTLSYFKKDFSIKPIKKIA